jgi:hypothetical protein
VTNQAWDHPLQLHQQQAAVVVQVRCRLVRWQVAAALVAVAALLLRAAPATGLHWMAWKDWAALRRPMHTCRYAVMSAVVCLMTLLVRLLFILLVSPSGWKWFMCFICILDRVLPVAS